MAYKESDVKRKIEYYADTANLLLEEEAYDIASDFFTLAGFYSLSVGDSAQAKDFTDNALESCKKGNIEDHHYIFALSLKELSSGNINKAIEYWNKTKTKYTEDEIDLVEQVLGSHREAPPIESTESTEALDNFLEAAHTEERISMDVFEEIALETTRQESTIIDESPQETVTPYWAEEESQASIEKEVSPQPETTIQEPEEEWQLVPQPSELPQKAQPKIEPIIKEEPKEMLGTPQTINPPPKPFVPPQSPLRPQIPPVAPRPSPQERVISTPKVTIPPKPLPLSTEPPAAMKMGAPTKPAPPTRVTGKNLYGRIRISDMAWRVGRTENELVEALSNLINRGKISGFVQAGEYIQTPDEAMTQLSTPGVTAPPTEAPSQFFTSSEADVTAETKAGYKRCGVCGAEIQDWTKICPKCGAKQ